MNLLEVIETYGYKLEKRGVEWWMSCPFHEDKKPSFSISKVRDNYVFYCFSCKRGGSVVDFIAYHDHISRAEAKNKLNKEEGIVEKVDEKRELFNNMINKLHINALQSPEFYNYMVEERGIGVGVLKTYKIGFCKDLQDVLEYKEFFQDFGMINDMGRISDISNSVIYPFFDAEGVFKFYSRKIDDKSYISTDKKGIYWKRSLFGLQNVRTDFVDIYEGFNDVLVAADSRIPAVAMCGTNMFDEYWEQLRERNIKDVTFVPDGDAGGKAFLIELLKSGYPKDFNVKIKSIDEDPDDEIHNGSYYKRKSYHLLEWYVENQKVQNIIERIDLYKEITPYYLKLSKVEQIVIRDYFIKKFGENGIEYLYEEVKPDFDAERIVLSNAVYSKDIKLETLQLLDEDDFHSKQNKEMFLLLKKHDNVTNTLIKSIFNIELADIDLINYKEYIETVHNIRVREKIYDRLDKFKSSVGDVESIGEMMDEFHKIALNKNVVEDSDNIIKRVVRRISDDVNNKDLFELPFSDSFPILNNSLLGYRKGKLILLSGNTGHGKTQIVCNFIDDLIDRNIPTLFVSLEMTPDELIERQIVIKTGINGAKIITASLDQNEYNVILSESKKIMNSSLHIVYGVYNIHKILAIIKSQIMKNKIRVVFIDYVQLIRMKSNLDRWEQLMTFTNLLKTEICTLGPTVIALSQLKKSALDSNVPSASDQSGSYGMLADVDVGMTIRRKTGKEIKDGSNFMIYIDKHRYGVDNVLIDCVFDRATLRIREV